MPRPWTQLAVPLLGHNVHICARKSFLSISPRRWTLVRIKSDKPHHLPFLMQGMLLSPCFHHTNTVQPAAIHICKLFFRNLSVSPRKEKKRENWWHVTNGSHSLHFSWMLFWKLLIYYGDKGILKRRKEKKTVPLLPSDCAIPRHR